MKKPTKRKMYQKRRKKEKAEQRKKATRTKLPTAVSSKNNYSKNTNKLHLYNLYPTNYNDQQQLPALNHSLSTITSYSQTLQLWWRTYCSAIEFHCQQQNAWKDDNQDNQILLLEKYAKEYETSSEEEDDSDCQNVTVLLNSNKATLDNESDNDEAVKVDIDEEYLKFLEITHKHREELRLKKAQENI